MSSQAALPPFAKTRNFRWAMAVALAILTTIGAIAHPEGFGFSYLSAFVFYFTICAGALFWLLIHYLTRAVWSVAVRRQIENLSTGLIVLAVLFVPIFFVAPRVWAWMSLAPAADPLLDSKHIYLNVPFFWIRSAICLIGLSAIAMALRSLSLRQDADGAHRWTRRARGMALAAMPCFAIGLTFVAVDWLMGLDYHWVSSIWGVYHFAGSALSGLCALVVLLYALRHRLHGVVTAEHFHILGKLLLAFTMFWAYIAYSQYLLIWYANLPTETSFFALRSSGNWRWLSMLLVAGHFIIPFLLLLPYRTKRIPGYLAAVAAGLLTMHYLDIYLIVQPIAHPGTAFPSWMDVLCLLSIGSILLEILIEICRKSALWPHRDKNLNSSIHLKN